MALPGPPVRVRQEQWLGHRALADVLVVSAVVIAAVLWVVLVTAGGWEYYTTPLRVRAYAAGHRMLRPSGWLGHSLGVVGLLMMTVPVAYSLRKKWKRLAGLGDMRYWLNVHIFCGIVGPVLVTLHAALKFNGLISVAYWSMVLVVLSGFVGRYWYVRIPRTIRGVELTCEEIGAHADTLRDQLLATGMSPGLLEPLITPVPRATTDSPWSRMLDPWRRARGHRAARAALLHAGLAPHLVREAVRLGDERAFLLRRLQYLQRTRRLFAMWHVFHQPLVYVMFGIAALHISLAVYLGYAVFPW